jgi:hypothetical protein
MSRTIEIIVTPEGKTTVQTLGFTGSSCRAASKVIEQALGASVGDYPTAEFYQAQQAEQHQSQRQ